MKKIILSIIAFSLLSFATEIKAQCTPDSSIHTTGTYPSYLDTAKVGVMYNQIIQYHITKDTMYAGNGVTIDSMWITGVKGLPVGFTYTCFSPRCSIKGGQTGCVNLKGTPVANSSRNYPLTVYFSIRATLKGSLPIGQTISDSVTKYYIVVKSPAAVEEVGANNTVLVYPNPAKENLQVYIPNEGKNFSYQIFNLTGTLVQKGETNGFEPVKEIGLNQLSQSVYLIHINDNGKQYLKKFIVGE
ncbi:MAG: T9SS type A sorting domain-containing protein [Bacteroidia bacterium]|nr:T9SS type A sorting domain-containing protein [Bacteroidia bacterium]